MSNVIAPCPWCDSVAVTVVPVSQHVPEGRLQPNETAGAVVCFTCGARGPVVLAVDMETAVRLWAQAKRRGQ